MLDFPYCKLEIFLPHPTWSCPGGLRQADAGHIGRYDSCLSYHPSPAAGGLEGTHPYLAPPAR